MRFNWIGKWVYSEGYRVRRFSPTVVSTPVEVGVVAQCLATGYWWTLFESTTFEEGTIGSSLQGYADCCHEQDPRSPQEQLDHLVVAPCQLQGISLRLPLEQTTLARRAMVRRARQALPNTVYLRCGCGHRHFHTTVTRCPDCGERVRPLDEPDGEVVGRQRALNAHVTAVAAKREFDEQVLAEVRRLSTPQPGEGPWFPGARFPCVVDLCYHGNATDAAKRLGLKSTEHEPVYRALKRLHAGNRVVFVWRGGYTWVIPTDQTDLYEAGEVVENPSDAPYNWDRL